MYVLKTSCQWELLPGEYGFPMSDLQSIRVESPAESKAMLLDVLADEPGPARDIVLLNAGAALYIAGVAASIGEGVAKARQSVSSGAARAKLDQYVSVTQGLASS